MIMKKQIIVTLLCVCSIFTLIGCGKKNNTSDSDDDYHKLIKLLELRGFLFDENQKKNLYHLHHNYYNSQHLYLFLDQSFLILFSKSVNFL